MVHCSQKAVIIVPVADLLGAPIKKSFPHLSTQEGYDQLPLSGGNTNPYTSCMRLHQLLFNETVDIIDRKGDELLIQVPNFFHTSSTNSTPQHSYWTQKKNVVTFKELNKKKLDLNNIPVTPSFVQKKINNNNVAVLAMPYTDSITQQTFSAGTRFVPTRTTERSEQDQKSHVTVYVFDKNSFTFKEIAIPRSLILNQTDDKTEIIKQFVELIRRWTQVKGGFIPYVWGGTSFICISNGTYEETELMINNAACSYYNLSDYTASPKTGMDCTGLVVRAAQMCGIPYFFKNSTTVATHLKPLKSTQKLQEGDIIWGQRHIMVVADLNNNTLFEARGRVYNGQGKIQEIALNQVFKGIDTYDQLVKQYHDKKPLYRLGNDNEVVQTWPEFKLLKLASIWD